jgi:hypothetical protein
LQFTIRSEAYSRSSSFGAFVQIGDELRLGAAVFLLQRLIWPGAPPAVIFLGGEIQPVRKIPQRLGGVPQEGGAETRLSAALASSGA